MVSRQRQTTTRREWQAEEARGFTDPGFRGIAAPGEPQEAPGDETYLGNETIVGDGDLAMVAALPGGGHVIAYRLGDAAVGVRAFDASGTLLWTEAFLPLSGTTYLLPAVAGLADGSVIVAFQSTVSGQGSNIVAQRIDASGDPVGAIFTVNNPAVTGNQNWPSITVLQNGNTLIAWGTQVNGTTDEIRGQLYTSAGTAVGGNFQLNAPNTLVEGRPVIDALPGGGFVAAWITQVDNSAPIIVHAQRFDAAGVRVGPEIVVGETNAEQIDISALSDGGFVVGWSRDNSNYDGSSGTGGQVYARRYGPDGTPAPEGRITVIETFTAISAITLSTARSRSRGSIPTIS